MSLNFPFDPDALLFLNETDEQQQEQLEEERRTAEEQESQQAQQDRAQLEQPAHPADEVHQTGHLQQVNRGNPMQVSLGNNQPKSDQLQSHSGSTIPPLLRSGGAGGIGGESDSPFDYEGFRVDSWLAGENAEITASSGPPRSSRASAGSENSSLPTVTAINTSGITSGGPTLHHVQNDSTSRKLSISKSSSSVRMGPPVTLPREPFTGLEMDASDSSSSSPSSHGTELRTPGGSLSSGNANTNTNDGDNRTNVVGTSSGTSFSSSLHHHGSATVTSSSVLPTSSSSSSASTIASKSVGPGRDRFSHNIIEKKYRRNINFRIAELRNAVPTLRALDEASSAGKVDISHLEGLTPARRLNKANILTKATEYIRHLEDKNQNLVREVQALRSVIDQNRLVLPPELRRSSSAERPTMQFINYVQGNQQPEEQPEEQPQVPQPQQPPVFLVPMSFESIQQFQQFQQMQQFQQQPQSQPQLQPPFDIQSSTPPLQPQTQHQHQHQHQHQRQHQHQHHDRLSQHDGALNDGSDSVQE